MNGSFGQMTGHFFLAFSGQPFVLLHGKAVKASGSVGNIASVLGATVGGHRAAEAFLEKQHQVRG